MLTRDSLLRTPRRAQRHLSPRHALVPATPTGWDRCAAGVPARSLRLRGTPGKLAALNINCIGEFQYTGGWTDRAFGGTLSTSSGCHKGGASAVVLCDGSVEKMDADLQAVCGSPTPPPANHTWPTRPFYVLDPAKYTHMLGDDAQWAERTVPYIDVPDTDVLEAFYYRWRGKHDTVRTRATRVIC